MAERCQFFNNRGQILREGCNPPAQLGDIGRYERYGCKQQF